MTVLHRCAHRAEAPAMLRPGKPGTALFATLALLGAEFVELLSVRWRQHRTLRRLCSDSALRLAADGLMVDIVKRRAPSRAEPLSIPLQATPVLLSSRRGLVRRPLTEVARRIRTVDVADA